MTSRDNKGRRSRFWAYRYHIHLDGKVVDLHVTCFKEMIHRNHGMPLPPIKTPLLKLTTMACPQDEQLMAPLLWTTSSKRPQPGMGPH